MGQENMMEGPITLDQWENRKDRTNPGDLSSGQQSQHTLFFSEASLNWSEKPLSDGFVDTGGLIGRGKAATMTPNNEGSKSASYFCVRVGAGLIVILAL